MPIVWTDVPEANELLEADPLALLIGLVLDQQVKMEKAFRGPYDLKQRLGHLDARKIAAMDPDRLLRVFRERPALHRFPGSMSGRVQALCKAILDDYDGDAARVWTEARPGQEVQCEAGRLGEARRELAHGGGRRFGGVDGRGAPGEAGDEGGKAPPLATRQFGTPESHATVKTEGQGRGSWGAPGRPKAPLGFDARN